MIAVLGSMRRKHIRRAIVPDAHRGDHGGGGYHTYIYIYIYSYVDLFVSSEHNVCFSQFRVRAHATFNGAGSVSDSPRVIWTSVVFNLIVSLVILWRIESPMSCVREFRFCLFQRWSSTPSATPLLFKMPTLFDGVLGAPPKTKKRLYQISDHTDNQFGFTAFLQ